MRTKLPPGFAQAAIVRALLLIGVAALIAVCAVLFVGLPEFVVPVAIGLMTVYVMASTHARLRYRLSLPPVEVARPTGDRVTVKS